MLFKKILVPYDGSQLSEKALKLAVEIGKITGHSQVSILNVIEEIPLPTGRFNVRFRSINTDERVSASAYFKELYKDMQLNMKNKLERKKQQFYDNKSSISIETYVLVGSPSEKIIEFAKDYRTDLIVIGSTGLRGISRFFKGLGSVSRNVSEKVSCPTLIVR